jgi:cardiolipin synthase
LRIANSVGAALSNHRVLGDVAKGPLLTATLVCTAVAVVAVLWPASIGWPFAALAGWTGLNLGIRSWRQRGRYRREGERDP